MIKKIKIEQLIFLSIMLLLIAFPIIIIVRYTCLCLNLGNLSFLNRAHLLWWIALILFILYILNLWINKKKINYVDILLYGLIILGVLGTIYAIDVKTSIYGTYGRNEGLLSLLAYYFILLNLKNMTNEKYRNIIIKTLIILGIVHVIYGILQVYTNLSFIKHYQEAYMASSLSGNPNFFGSYMVMMASFVFAMFILERKRKYLILTLIFFGGLCLSSSTGPFLSFLLMIVFFTIYYRKRIKWLDYLKVLCLCVIIYFLVDYSIKYVHTNIFKNNISDNYNISMELKNLKLSESSNARLMLWKDSLPLVKKYWVVGSGLDTFGQIYGIRNGTYYDKVHNVYLQIAITNGIFAFLIYVVLMVIILLKGLKLKDIISIALFMAFISYSIQAFANISVIEVAPSFYVICGLLLGSKRELVK